MTTEYVWSDLRQYANELYEDTPGAAIEARILDVFRRHPQIVARGIDHVAEQCRKGTVHSPWAVLAVHVEGATRPLEEATASDTSDRDKTIRRAEQWLRASGKHFDRWAEVAEVLFVTGWSDKGTGLAAWAKDEALRERMAKLWREVRPEGELVSEQAEERARRWEPS